MIQKIKELLRNNVFIIRIRLLKESLYHYFHYAKYSGAINKELDRDKYKASLLIAIHSIEKGLSLPKPRLGFGEKKIEKLLKELDFYTQKYEDDFLLKIAHPILDEYIQFNTLGNYRNQKILDSYSHLFSISSSYKGGLKTVNYQEVKDSVSFDYFKFITTRHSIRDFSSKPIDKDLIIKALKLSSNSPSACNRQPWHVYVYNGTLKKELLLWQQGNRGFTDSINSVILVTCSLKSYFINEMHLPYVDGGLYAMNLINAFHSMGIGTIPLTMAVMSKRMNGFYDKFKVEKEDIPILLIGIGHLKESFKVAVSEKFYSDTFYKFVDE